MKTLTLLSIAIILTFSNQLNAQIPTWPPDGIKPSPYALLLPEGRFVPSTKRYNLVWADQIVPNWVTPKQVEFAAKNYVGTQKIWSYQIDEFRKYNSNFLGLIYHLASGLNPKDNSDCPEPKDNSEGNISVVSPAGYVSEWTEHFLPWLADKGIELGTDTFESMFQHYDEFDLQHRVWHKDPYWLMNLDNEDWSDYLIDQCNDWMEGNENEGCFFDVSVETNSFLYNPNQYNPEPTNFNWWQSPHKPFGYESSMVAFSDFAPWMNELYLKYYQKIYRSFHRAIVDYLVIPNVDQLVTTVYEPTWLEGNDNGETIDGAMMEGFGNYRGQDMWLTLDRCIRYITGRGKIFIAQFDADTPEERYRRTAMYMLVKNENSFININPQEVGWYPEYEIDLGEQSESPKSLDELRIDGEGWQSLWLRDYDNGLVVCNTSNKIMTIMTPDIPTIKNSGDNWFIIRTYGGGKVDEEGKLLTQDIEKIYLQFSTEIEIEPSDCLIIYSEPFTNVKSNHIIKYEFSISPNPAQDYISINLNNPSNSSIIIGITDILGREVKGFEYRENNIIGGRITINISDLTTGSYIIHLIINNRIYSKSLSIIR